MSAIIWWWKLVKHLDCFGDNRKLKDTRKNQVMRSLLRPIVVLVLGSLKAP